MECGDAPETARECTVVLGKHPLRSCGAFGRAIPANLETVALQFKRLIEGRDAMPGSARAGIEHAVTLDNFCRGP
jgi:hypothetical protein